MNTSKADKIITSSTSINEAGEIWLARLELAGLDDSEDEAVMDEEELALREEQRHHSRQTINSYRTAFNLFARWLHRQGRRVVSAIELDDLVSYARSLRRRDYDLSIRAAEKRESDTTSQSQRLSPRTIRGYTRPLLGFLALLESFDAIHFRTEAVRAELVRVLPRLPETVAPTPPDLRRVVGYYDWASDEEDKTPRLRMIRLRNATLLHILFSSGARISEALNLNVGQVYRDRKVQSRVQIFGKGRRDEVIFLRKSAERAIWSYLVSREYPPASEPLFISHDRRTAGSRLSRASGWRIVNQAANAVANRIEIEGRHDEADLLRTASPHTFRHYVGFYLLNEGADLSEVSQILRHRSVDVTRSFYARYKDTQLQEVHDQFSPDPSWWDSE